MTSYWLNPVSEQSSLVTTPHHHSPSLKIWKHVSWTQAPVLINLSFPNSLAIFLFIGLVLVLFFLLIHALNVFAEVLISVVHSVFLIDPFSTIFILHVLLWICFPYLKPLLYKVRNVPVTVLYLHVVNLDHYPLLHLSSPWHVPKSPSFFLRLQPSIHVSI